MFLIIVYSHFLSLHLLQVSLYITEGLERARESLTEAAALRERFVLGTSVSRRVAAAAASAVITIHFITISFVYYFTLLYHFSFRSKHFL